MRGVFDDCQDIVKAVSNDDAFKARYSIGTVNSINWARVAAQVVYYFKGYFAATKSDDAAGRRSPCRRAISATSAPAISRACMGLPMRRLILATNENDVLDEFFRTGVYRVRPPSEVQQTSQPVDGHFQSVELRALRLRPGRARRAHGDARCGGRSSARACSISPARRILRATCGLRFRLRLEHATPTGWRPSARVYNGSTA